MINKIIINPTIFLNAVINSLPLKRSPVGGKSKITKQTTLLPSNKNKLLIETPFKSVLIDIDGFWREKINVDALTLERVSKALIESDHLCFWVSGKQLIIIGKAQFTIPIQ